MEGSKYFKIFNETIAETLLALGFAYIKETLGDGGIIYAFENTEELHAALQDIWCKSGFAEIPYVEEDTITL